MNIFEYLCNQPQSYFDAVVEVIGKLQPIEALDEVPELGAICSALYDKTPEVFDKIMACPTTSLTMGDLSMHSVQRMHHRSTMIANHS